MHSCDGLREIGRAAAPLAEEPLSGNRARFVNSLQPRGRPIGVAIHRDFARRKRPDAALVVRMGVSSIRLSIDFHTASWAAPRIWASSSGGGSRPSSAFTGSGAGGGGGGVDVDES
jgi:hypothetical protein